MGVLHGLGVPLPGLAVEDILFSSQKKRVSCVIDICYLSFPRLQQLYLLHDDF